MKRSHEIVESRPVFRGKLLEVFVDKIRLPDGSVGSREIVRHPGAVAVVAVQDGKVLLVRQNRHAVGEDLLELPAGKLDLPGEDAVGCAQRELEEETGYRATALQPLGSFLPSPGFSDERIHLFLAERVIESQPPARADEGEPISSAWMDFPEALAAVRTGIIQDSKTMIGLMLAADRLGMW